MTEDEIERVAERTMDHLDARLMAGKLTPTEYDAAVRRLDALTEQRLARCVDARVYR